MKFKLPLLLLLSLMWQGAVWGAEWADLATAVTVTEGYLCAGEAALDGTGTDVKCDDSNPYIDDDGNIGIGTVSPANSLTVVGDISATTINATQLCDENGANCTTLSGGLSGASILASLTDVSVSTPSENNLLRYNTGTSKWEAVGINDGLSTTTMVPGWPDAIDCGNTNNSSRPYIYFINLQYSTGVETYYQSGTTGGGGDVVRFNTASKEVSVAGGSVCTSGKSIADLYSEGRAFNFLGNNGAQTSLTEIADVSASAPTEGQLLRYDASENEWVATDVISKTIIYNSIDDDPCVITGGVRKLSFNPTTGRLRVCRP